MKKKLKLFGLLFSTSIVMLTVLSSCNNDDDDNVENEIANNEAILGKWELASVVENGQEKDIDSCSDNEFYTFTADGYQLQKFESIIKAVAVLPCKEKNLAGFYTIEGSAIIFDKGQKNERKLEAFLEADNLSLTFERSPVEVEKIRQKIADGIFDVVFFPISDVLKGADDNKEIKVTQKFKRVIP